MSNITPFTDPVADEDANAREKLHDIMWKGQQIEALLIGIQPLAEYGDGNIDAMDTLAYIARPMINEVRNMADGLSGEISRRQRMIQGGAK